MFGGKEKIMKYLNIIKLLSVLLCICMLLASCAPADGSAETNNPTELLDEELLSGVEAKRENFFTLFTPTNNALSEAIRPVEKADGVETDERVVIYKTSTVDAKNNVKEKYEIFNTDDEKVVLTLENTYANGYYDDFDWEKLFVLEYEEIESEVDDTGYIFKTTSMKKYPTSVLEVSIERLSDYQYILVKEAAVTPIDEELHEENPDGAVYEIKTKYTYYDIGGQKIGEFVMEEPRVGEYGSMSGDAMVLFGNISVLFDEETGKAVRTCNVDNEVYIGAYHYETEKYGYFFGGGGYLSEYFDVYNKQTGERIARYYEDQAYDEAEVYLLHNGDLLVQYLKETDKTEPYDFSYSDPMLGEEGYYSYSHVIFDASEGKAKEVEFPYIVKALSQGEDIKDELREKGIALTDNVRNIANVFAIENKIAKEDELLVLDNDLTVLYKFDRIIPEHTFYINPYGYDDVTLGFEVLPGGDYLVYLDTPIEGVDRAIVGADGKLRSYLKYDYIVAEDFIYDGENVIYDYDMNVVYKIVGDEPNYIDEEYSFAGVLGGVAVLESEEGNKFAFKKSANGGGYEITPLFDGEKVSVIEANKDYLIVRETDSGNYVLYNTSFAHVLTSENEISVFTADGYFIINTYSNILEQTLVYTVKE